MSEFSKLIPVAACVTVAELADELGCRKQNLFKIIDRLGIRPVKVRSAERGNQLVSTITSSEAVQIRVEFATRQPTTQDLPTDSEQFFAQEGLFYLILLEPDHDPGRIKVGFTTDLDARLQKHRCSAPFARYLKMWPCRRTWERAAIDCIADGLEQLHTEVFRTESVEQVMARAQQFFNLMPNVCDPLDINAEDYRFG